MSKVMVTESYLEDIADAIRAKSGTQDTYKPAEMADAIESISGGGITPTGTINITQNGTTDVTNYASANVNVPNPSAGTISITANGTVDVTQYASANVNVPNPSTGTKQISITQNGTVTEDVTNYANAEIAVNVSGGNYLIAGGTFTLGTDNKTVYVDVDFEPTHAIVYGDQADVTQTAWNSYAVMYFDSLQTRSASLQARLYNESFGMNVSVRDPSVFTYSDGKFKFYDTGYAFKAGRTYTWYCWRERS